MSSVDRAVMLEALGWSRGGKASYKDRKSKYRDQSTHLPDDIVKIIHRFTFFDVRTEAYQQHIEKEETKYHKLYVLHFMMFQINDGLRRYGTGKYEVEYNSINIGSNCCTVCGNFVALWDPIPENIRCSCRFLTEEEIMDLEHERQDNYYLEEEAEEDERDRERRRKNREFDKEFGDWDYETYSLEDDPYSDREPNWDEGSECSLDYDYCDDDNSYF